jgi:hypothetical protein
MMQTLNAMMRHMVSQFGDMELYTAILIGAMIVVWTIGSLANRQIANVAATEMASTLSAQFAAPGSVAKESNSHFFLYSTGRARCSGAIVSLKLAPRQDFISRFGVSWVWKSWYPKDRASVEIFDAEIDAAVTLFVCRKWQMKALTEKIAEISKFCKPSNGVLEGSGFGSFSTSSLTGFTCLCDAGGKAAASAIFPRLSIAESVLRATESIYVSSESKSIKFDLESVPHTETEWKELLEYAFAFLDALAAVKVSEAVRTEVTNQRSAEATKQAREAELAKRREELEKQKADQLKSMSAAEREKLDEKRKLKERKKNAKSGRVLL